jgi:hypothetical protein
MARSFLALSLLSSVLLALVVPAASQCKYPLSPECLEIMINRFIVCQASSVLQLGSSCWTAAGASSTDSFPAYPAHSLHGLLQH